MIMFVFDECLWKTFKVVDLLMLPSRLILNSFRFNSVFSTNPSSEVSDMLSWKSESSMRSLKESCCSASCYVPFATILWSL